MIIYSQYEVLCSDGQLDSRVHELNWIQFTKYESKWIEPNLFSSESDFSWIHWICWESWVWIELDLVESCNDESELSLNPIYMNPRWIWIHYFQERIQESTQRHVDHLFFEPRKSIWEFPTRDNERSCSKLVLYFYVYCITLRNVQHFGSKPSSVTQLMTNKTWQSWTHHQVGKQNWDRKSTRLNSSHSQQSRMPSSAWKKKQTKMRPWLHSST